jgi:hypothetical protein
MDASPGGKGSIMHAFHMFSRVGLCLLASASPGHAANAAAAAAELKGYLPASGSFAAEYVVIERDPNFDVYAQRIRAAMEANREWLADYRAKHAGKELPYHPNFGVSEADYLHYKLPINQFREVSRQRIRVDKRAAGSTVNLRLQGENLLLNELQIDTDTPAVKTSRGPLAFREVVNLERASLPPAVHQGISFNTPDAIITTGKFRESALVGKLKGTSTGIIYYSLNTPGRVDMAYVVYPLGN